MRERLIACDTLRWYFKEVPVMRRGKILPCSLRNFFKNSGSLKSTYLIPFFLKRQYFFYITSTEGGVRYLISLEFVLMTNFLIEFLH